MKLVFVFLNSVWIASTERMTSSSFEEYLTTVSQRPHNVPASHVNVSLSGKDESPTPTKDDVTLSAEAPTRNPEGYTINAESLFHMLTAREREASSSGEEGSGTAITTEAPEDLGEGSGTTAELYEGSGTNPKIPNVKDIIDSLIVYTLQSEHNSSTVALEEASTNTTAADLSTVSSDAQIKAEELVAVNRTERPQTSETTSTIYPDGDILPVLSEEEKKYRESLLTSTLPSTITNDAPRRDPVEPSSQTNKEPEPSFFGEFDENNYRRPFRKSEHQNRQRLA